MENEIKNYIIYLRKSRSDSPDMSVEEVLLRHEKQLQEYSVHKFGETIPENQIYREVVSGETIADRPVMKLVMKLLETETIKGVIVIEPQRLSRGDLEDCGKIINTFRYTKTLVMTPQKTYDLNDEYDRKFFEMELTRGNDYLEYTKKILNRGRIASVKNGNYIGSIPPYGYQKIKVGTGKDAYHTLEIIPEEANAIRLMYHLFVKEGYGFTRIARYLDNAGIKPKKANHWSPSAIKDMLENPVYIGKIRWNWRKTEKVMTDGEIIKRRPKTKNETDWIYTDGRHEAIIDEATFYATLDKRGKSPKVKKNKELVNPFAGLLFCACGKCMSYKKSVETRSKNHTINESMLCNQQAICHSRSVQYKDFLDRVITILENAIANFEIQLQNDDGNATKLHQNIIKNLELDLKKLKEKDERQKDAFDDGVYTKAEYISRNAKVQEQIAQVMDALKQARKSTPAPINYHQKIVTFQDCLIAIKNPDMPAKDKNVLLKTCIEKIIYKNDNVAKPGIGRYVENNFELEIYFKI